ncbi:hypothetical protein ACFWNK_19885 [Streptomyces sp. NPDC058417]|uniref:hypothetical protein n=1 Tax=unclassified Streptomyces TaxID=2593676 RepID=UPI00364EB5C2
MEIRLTHTVLPAHTTAKPADVGHGPVAARTLRSGCRISLFDTDRLIHRVEYLHADNYLRLHTSCRPASTRATSASPNRPRTWSN